MLFLDFASPKAIAAEVLTSGFSSPRAVSASLRALASFGIRPKTRTAAARLPVFFPVAAERRILHASSFGVREVLEAVVDGLSVDEPLGSFACDGVALCRADSPEVAGAQRLVVGASGGFDCGHANNRHEVANTTELPSSHLTRMTPHPDCVAWIRKKHNQMRSACENYWVFRLSQNWRRAQQFPARTSPPVFRIN